MYDASLALARQLGMEFVAEGLKTEMIGISVSVRDAISLRGFHIRPMLAADLPAG